MTSDQVTFQVLLDPTSQLGDVNHDGGIDIVDALMVAQYYVGILDDTQIDVVNADVNLDGMVDIIDALRIAQFYVGIIPNFAV